MRKCVLVGYGYWGKILKTYIDDSKEFELIDVVGRMPYDLYVSYIKHTEANIVFVCAPKSLHYELVRVALESKKDVFCEKPLTGDLVQAKNLFTLAQMNGCVLYTDFVYTFSESVRLIKQVLEKNKSIENIEMSFLQYGAFYKDCSAIENLGVHLLSVLLFLFNNAIVRINSVTNSYIYDNQLPTEQYLNLIVNGNVPVHISVSVNNFEKQRNIRVMLKNAIVSCDLKGSVYTDTIEKTNNTYHINRKITVVEEDNNLKYLLDDFEKVVNSRNNKSNEELALRIEEILENIKTFK